MKSFKLWGAVTLILVLSGVLLSATAFASDGNDIAPPTVQVSDPVVPKLSPVMRDVVYVPPDRKLNREEINPIKNPGLFLPDFGLTGTGTTGVDPLVAVGQSSLNAPSPNLNFEGQGDFALYSPPDTTGDVGPNHFVQMVNVETAIYDKTGTLLTNFANNQLWAGFGGPCQNDNSGDPIVLYDDMADRWLLSQFAVSTGQFMCLAISVTPDPTGAYYLYGFPMPDFPDYPKLGVWPDGYYLGTNTGYPNQYYAHVMDRTSMLAGTPATMQSVGGQANFLMPADADGILAPPAGDPGVFYTFFDGGYPNHPAGVDRIALFEFDVDWATPGNTTFGLVQEIPITDFNYTTCGFFERSCLDQLNTVNKLDAVDAWPMVRLQYRNLANYQVLVGNFTVDADGTDHAGIRWFELRKTGPSWSLFQEGTWAPDAHNRFMASIAVDGSGNLALGYSITSATMYPSIRYTVHGFGDPVGTMQAEAELMAGGGSQTSSQRWGDYSATIVDPSDNCTFWITNMYHDVQDTGYSWNTRIGTFVVPGCTGSLNDLGTLDGTVTDASTTNPIENAGVSATLNVTETFSTSTDGLGDYDLTLPVGTYTVTASAFGYLPNTVTAVDVISGTATTLDMPLSPAPSYLVSGTVTDSSTGWPLYASLDIDGYPGDPIWTDPETGYYEITLPGGMAFNVNVSAWVPGYLPANRSVGPFTGNTTENFALDADTSTCDAPGYYEVTLVCYPPSDGGLVVGNIYDNHSLAAINGAMVENQAGYSAEAVETPFDGAIDDGFFSIFSPSGTQTFTATMDLYSDEIATPTVVMSDTIRQDFYMKSSFPILDPTSLHATVEMGATATLPITLTNDGDDTLDFEWQERGGGYIPLSQPVISIPASDGNFERDSTPVSFGPAPAVNAAPVAREIFAPDSAPAYAMDLLGATMIRFPDVDIPGTADIVGGTGTAAYFSGDFLNGDFSKMYAIDYNTNQLFAVSTADASAVLIGSSVPNGGESWTGMTGSVDGIMYASSTNCATSTLYILDVTDGSLTTIGAISNGPCIIDIAINHDGEIYGVDIVNDVLVQIDPATGAGTVIGSVGVNANYAQGMDFEDESGVLYWASYSSQGEMRIIDTVTGASALVGAFPGGTEVDCLAFPTSGAIDVPWLSEDPISGTLPTLNDVVVDINFDASVPDVTQPGDYYAALRLKNNSPLGPLHVPITMTVNPPANYGMLEGTVTGLGYCDADPAPLAEAEVLISGSSGVTYTLMTDVGGFYSWWLDEADSPYTIDVMVAEHEAGYASGVSVVGGVTTTQDFGLRWLEPCVNPTPSSLSVALDAGEIVTVPLNLYNNGPISTTFRIREEEGEFLPAAPLVGEEILVVNEDTESTTAVEAALASLGYTYLEVTNTTFTGMTVAELLNYLAVIYVGIPSSGAEQDQSMAYMDAGGSFMTADNDIGYFYNGTTFYDGYLQSTYVSDSGSDGVVSGMDIMAGISTDISADPWPDDFTANAEGVGIFQAPSGNLAGLRVDRMGYRGVYLAWDFEYTGAAEQTPIMETVLGFLAPNDVPWLSVDPITGTLNADSMQLIDVIFDSSVPEVTEPGDYLAFLKVRSDDPINGNMSIPVTMTINVPSDYGQIEGTVTSPGYCEVDPAPLVGAEVIIVGTTRTLTITTNVDGYYSYWLDETEAPLAINVTADGYADGTSSGVPLTAGLTTTRDFDLRLMEPCVSVNPANLEVTLIEGFSDTVSLDLVNAGGLATDFKLVEKEGGYTPSLLFSSDTLAPQSKVRERLAGYDENATSTAGILTGGGTPVIGVLAAGDVLNQWSTGHTLSWGDGFDLSAGTVWINDNAVGGGSGLNEEFTVAGNLTGASFTPSFGGSWPGDMAYNPNTGMFWQVNVGGDNCIYEWDPTIPSATGSSICGATWTATSQRGLAWDPTDDSFFVGGWNEYIIYHVASDGAIIEQWTTGLSISGLAYNWEDGQLFVMENSTTDTISQFDVASGTVVNSFTVTGFGNFSGAGLAIDCGGNLWAANQTDNNAYLIDSGVPGALCFSDIPWLSTDPITGTLTADMTQIIDVTFDTMTYTVGTYTGTLMVKTDDPLYSKLEVPVTMHVEAIRYGVDVAAESDSLSGEPGSVVTYTVWVTNTGNMPDGYDMAAGPHDWDMDMPVSMDPMVPGESHAMEVAITIPADASDGDSDSVTITVESQADPTETAAITLTTEAEVISYGVELTAENESLSGEPGSVVTYTVWMTNTGNVPDGYDIAAGSHNWDMDMPIGMDPMAPAESHAMEVAITIPAEAGDGDSDLVTITVSSQGDPTVTAAITLITEAVIPEQLIYLPLIYK